MRRATQALARDGAVALPPRRVRLREQPLERRSAARRAAVPAPLAPGRLRLVDGPAWLALRIAADLVTLVAACLVAPAVAPGDESTAPLALFVPLTLLLLDCGGRYRQRMRDATLDSAAGAFGAISIGAMTVFALQALTANSEFAGGALLAWTWLIAVVAVTSVSMALTAVQRSARRRGVARRRTLIVGADTAGLEIAGRMRRMPEYGMHPIGFLDAAHDGPHPVGAPPVLGTLDDLKRVARRHGVDNVVIGFPSISHTATLQLIAHCDELGLQTTVVPRLSAAVNHQTRFEYFGTQPVLNLRAVDRKSWRFAFKHAIDRVAAAVLLVALSPLLAAIALAVVTTSPGPVLFRQRRAGRDGQLFELLKFRTMVDCDEAAAGKRHCRPAPRGIAPGGVEGPDRRTTVGRYLRSTSLDELPQLVNVLRGEMSLIGPRPERPELAEMFRHEVERYSERHRVRSGITGWAQVHGLRGQTPLADRVELDNFYIEHWSLALDLKIALLTLPALLRGS